MQNTPKKLNIALSWIHYLIAVIVVFDTIYILNYSLNLSNDNASYLVGSVIGKVILIAMHIIAARNVTTGAKRDRIFSLLLTFFVLFAYPVGTIFGVIMLILLWKWDQEHENADLLK